MSFTKLNDDDKQILLGVAKNSIQHGLKNHSPLPVKLNEYSPLLKELGASFITLNLNNQLRGCIGTLEAFQPLIADVSEHAYAAAFKDPRFSPLTENEFEKLEVHISVLTKSSAIDFSDEADLLRQLRPGVDGLILQKGAHRATFLPSVWEQLPAPEDFLNHLKMKAGLSEHYWSRDIEVSRYQTISFS
jgi:uncharacterized protein